MEESDMIQFGRNGCFHLVPIEEIYKTYDATRDRIGLDYLVPIQERFWVQLEQVSAVSYIAMGDQDVVVSKRRDFIERLCAGARHGTLS
jgi:hypothetical protein